jgi:hypothetical protein
LSVPKDNRRAGSYVIPFKTMDIILERVMNATAVVINRARAMKAIAAAIVIIERVERVLDAIAVVIFRERVMQVITASLALLAIAIALPSIF